MGNEKLFYLVSVPKAGRTWLRLLLGKIFELHFKINLKRDKYIFKEIFQHTNPRLKIGHWRVWNVLPSKDFDKINGFILLVRDIRDILVSSYFMKKYGYE